MTNTKNNTASKEKNNNDIQKQADRNVNIWAMLRDVLVKSISTGQFPLAIVGGLLVLIIFKMPSDKLSDLVFLIYNDVKNAYSLGGYILFFATVGGWYLHARLQRSMMQKEIDRVAAERNELQEMKLGNDFQPSNKTPVKLLSKG